MKKFILHTSVFAGSVLVFLLLLVMMQDTGLIAGRKKLYVEKNNQVKYDLMVLGSSRAMYTFNPTIDEGDKTIFNMGEEGQGFPSNYLMMKLFIEKHHIQIDRLLLEVDCYAFNGSRGFSRKFRDDYFVTDIDDPEVYEAFKKYRGNAFARTIKTFPQSASLIYCDFSNFVKYQVFSFKKYVPALQQRFEHSLEAAAKTKGFKEVAASKNIPLDTANMIMEQDDKAYFEKLIALCRQHQVKVYFYKAPILGCQLVQCKQTDAYLDSFTKANAIPFYNYQCAFQNAGSYSNQSHPVGAISTAITKDILNNIGLE